MSGALGLMDPLGINRPDNNLNHMANLKYHGDQRKNIEIRRVSRTMMKAPDLAFGENAKKEMEDLVEAASFFDFMEL